jgi:aquaporin Z
MKLWDAAFYIIAQFAGGVAGLFLLSVILGDLLGHPAVKYIVTRPGTHGQWIAFAAEFIISFVMFTTVLWASNTPRIARWTGLFAACLVLTYVTFEAPLSGPSMNPARSTASALASHLFDGLWIYFTAPVLGMQLAAALFCRADRLVYCAKLHHHNNARCIFNCAFGQLAARELGIRPTAMRKVPATV